MTAPTCRYHGAMHVVEEGTLNGTLVRYFACHGSPAEQVDTCPAHGANQSARDYRMVRGARAALYRANGMSLDPLPCRCRPARACSRAARTEDTSHAEPSLDLGGAV